VFFVNVLGFESSDDFTGYSIRGDASQPRLLAAVIGYLQDQQIQPDLNAIAQTAAQRSRIKLMISMRQRLVGRTIKSAH